MVGNAQDIASDTCQKRCLSGTSVGELHQHRTGNIMCGRVDLRPVNHYIVKASVLASLHTVTAPLRSFETQLSRPPCFQIWPPLVSPPCSYVKSFLGQDLERLAAYGPRPVAAAGSSEAEAVAALSVSLSGWSPMGQQPASLSSHPPAGVCTVLGRQRPAGTSHPARLQQTYADVRLNARNVLSNDVKHTFK